MITINLPEEMAADLLDSLTLKKIRYGSHYKSDAINEVVKQIKLQAGLSIIETQFTPYDFNKVQK